jgi:hypothetical protein
MEEASSVVTAATAAGVCIGGDDEDQDQDGDEQFFHCGFLSEGSDQFVTPTFLEASGNPHPS